MILVLFKNARQRIFDALPDVQPTAEPAHGGGCRRAKVDRLLRRRKYQARRSRNNFYQRVEDNMFHLGIQRVAGSPRRAFHLPQGRGCGVGRGRGAGVARGVGVGVAVGVGVGVGLPA